MKKISVLAVALAVIWAAGAMAFTPKHPVVARDDNTVLKKPQGPLPTPLLVSPGFGVGVTDYDWQRNGSMIKTVALDGLHGVHFYWTYRINGDQGTRRGYYNFKDETGAWLGGLSIEGRVSRMGSLGVLADGRAAPSSHVTGSIIFTAVSVDAARGAGAFNTTNVDSAVSATWPSIAVGGSDVIHVVSVEAPPIDYSRSTNQGATFSPYIALATDINGNGAEFLALVAKGTRAAFAYQDSACPAGGNIWLRESTDAGVTWGAKSPIFSNGSRYVGWVQMDALYSPTDQVHLVYTVYDSTTPSQGQIRHWSQATGETVVRNGNWNTNPGGNHLTVGQPSLGYQASANRWWCTWEEFTAADTSTEGYANGEIWAAYSGDGGTTWSGARNLTNSPTPGAPPGACADDRYQSLAAVVDDTLRILYESSFAGGSSLQDGSTITLDTMRYYQTPATVGVEEFSGSEKAPTSFELGASRPNPTGTKTAIQYSLPAAAEVNLSVYNAAGQLVETLASGHRAAGVHTANWEAKSAPAGVYFYRLTAGTFTRTRSMVVVR